jgi:Flp pilus assembly pilin Flp
MVRNWRREIMHLPSGEEGQALVEYGWTIVLIAILVVALLFVLGMIVFDMWTVIVDAWEAVWAGL